MVKTDPGGGAARRGVAATVIGAGVVLCGKEARVVNCCHCFPLIGRRRTVARGAGRRCRYAARGGHLVALQWMRDHDCPWDRWSVRAPLRAGTCRC
jgi:hypothetical protein